MADSSTPDQETPSSPPSKTRTIRDLYISANLYNHRRATKPPYIDQEKNNKVAVIRWMGTLLYLPGTGYITGATIGTLKGTIEGVRAIGSSTEPVYFRINKVLDSSIEGGMRIGGPLGMICLLYSTLEFGVAYKRKRFHPHDTINTVVAGFGTGALYKVISGQRRAAFSGVVGAVVAVAGKVLMKTNTLIFHKQYES